MAAEPGTIDIPAAVFRGMRSRGWINGDQVMPAAFRLRPTETGLTFGRTHAAATSGITAFGSAELISEQILALPHGLSFGPHPDRPNDCLELNGVPPYSTEEHAIDRAMTVASDLAALVIRLIR